jgi:hypothetical protein
VRRHLAGRRRKVLRQACLRQKTEKMKGIQLSLVDGPISRLAT